jgi:IS30 family transposase
MPLMRVCAQHVAGKSLSQIAEQFGVSEKTIDRDIRTELQTASFYPSSLDGQQIAQLRQVEAERLTKLWQRAQLALDMIGPRLGTEGERSLDGTAIARLVASGVAVSEQLSRLYGLHAPTRLISELLTVSHEKRDTKITISFDAGALEPPSEPVPGLEIFEGNGTTEQPRLLDTATAAVATEFPG